MKRIGYWLIIGSFLTIALVFGFFAWRDAQHATIEIEWTTGSEIDTAGFNIFRSVQPVNGFVKINSEIIPASTEPIVGGKYGYLDTDLLPGEIYYYILEEVEMDGTVTRHGPTEIKALPSVTGNLVLALLAGGFAILLVWIGENRNKQIMHVDG